MKTLAMVLGVLLAGTCFAEDNIKTHRICFDVELTDGQRSSGIEMLPDSPPIGGDEDVHDYQSRTRQSNVVSITQPNCTCIETPKAPWMGVCIWEEGDEWNERIYWPREKPTTCHWECDEEDKKTMEYQLENIRGVDAVLLLSKMHLLIRISKAYEWSELEDTICSCLLQLGPKYDRHEDYSGRTRPAQHP